MPDLLPPSPLSTNQSSRSYMPGPSHLNNSITPIDDTQEPARSVNLDSPAPQDTPPSPSGIRFAGSEAVTLPVQHCYSQNIAAGPLIQPLDMFSLMTSHDLTHAQLAKTVDELAAWLQVVEVGLTTMLDRTNQDIIEEEREELVISPEDVQPPHTRIIHGFPDPISVESDTNQQIGGSEGFAADA
ncbi:hypothetical protein NEOLEDRAFT_1057137 [Neolentinus lepideus HHB14362 ss-1]|uniref:Uncharacterized protein n=1 Tax=Neolentinus lepideus HHB14362 ss-1 TaxID=1314782 RepID=A0A165UZH2_9AGAM|nr:hypothetical protein NEOLEDRAFT_1057137 [Neolentinus lepideus HHB14362 ss-1]